MTNRMRGFTLIEILIVMTTISVVTVSMISVINPAKVINQAKDSQRNAELNREKMVLEEYLNDKDCYPTSIELSDKFESGSYLYVTDGSSCPKWYTIFSNLKGYTAEENACDIVSNCLPANYVKSWSCKTSGNYICPIIAAASLPVLPGQIAINNNQVGASSPTVTAVPTSVGNTSVFIPSPTTVPTGIASTMVPTATIGSTRPAIIAGLIGESGPTPTVSTKHDATGIDGTWCDDPDGGSYFITNSFCTDSAGAHYDYCSGSTAKEYYCDGTWNGTQLSNVHCSLGGYLCPTSCNQGACISNIGSTAIQQIGPSVNNFIKWLESIF